MAHQGGGALLSSMWRGYRQLIEIVPGRTADSAAAWFRSQPPEWLDGIRWAEVLDMSGPYRKAYDRVQSRTLSQVSTIESAWPTSVSTKYEFRRTQNETILGHRGRKDDPLYRIRRLLG